MSRHQGRLELTWTNKEKAVLSSGDGRYDYTFVDPSDRRVAEVRLLHDVERIDAETPADRPTNLPIPTTDNLLITGDAMHVLDALAKIPEYADQYLGKVKLVYIDPPFNTGQTFSNYEDNIEHSIWLTMLRDRLRQIKPLLSPEGTVWVHLDDSEVHRCRLVMDEEFGSENFVAEVAWRKRTSVANDSASFTAQHDILLVYGKAKGVTINRIPRAQTRDDLRYGSVDGDKRRWGTFGNTSAPKNVSNGRQVSACYAIQHPLTGEMLYPPRGGQWAFRTERIRAALDEYAEWTMVEPDVQTRCENTGLTADEVRLDVPDIVVTDLSAAQASTQTRISEGCWPEFFVQPASFGRKVYQAPESTSPPSTWWSDSDTGHNRESKSEIKALFPGVNPFATPKPERLLQRIIAISTSPGDIVLDCFAGSGTTAAVAHKMCRRWVTSELLCATVDTFIKARLAKVVRGEDPGGITSVTERLDSSKSGLPGNTMVKEAQNFNTVLTRITKIDGITLDKETIDALRTATRTRTVTTINWHGGGGFRHLTVGPSMFEDVDGLVVLADWAVNGDLARAMCAQLSIRHQPDGIFAGRHGRRRLVVIDGMVGRGTIDAVVDRLLDGENVEIWATQIATDAALRLKQLRSSSRLSRIPDAVLDGYRRKRAERSPFSLSRSEKGIEL